MGDPWYHHLNADCRFVGLSRFSFAVFGFGAKAKPLTVECKPKGWGEEGRRERESHTRNCIEKASSSEESVASLAALCAAAAANWELGIEMDAIQALI